MSQHYCSDWMPAQAATQMQSKKKKKNRWKHFITRKYWLICLSLWILQSMKDKVVPAFPLICRHKRLKTQEKPDISFDH